MCKAECLLNRPETHIAVEPGGGSSFSLGAKATGEGTVPSVITASPPVVHTLTLLLPTVNYRFPCGLK